MLLFSVTIITKNEGHDIRDCLESVRFADEIIILDSGSTDNTVEICKEYTDKVFSTDWPGFGMQKNRALEKATGDGTAGSVLHRLTRPGGKADLHKSKTQVERVRVIAPPHR